MQSKSPTIFLSLCLLGAAGCAVEFTGESTPPPDGGVENTPTPSDGTPQDNAMIEALYPTDGAEYLPPALQLTALLSASWQGADGEITGRFGESCDSGVILMPQFSDDRREVRWQISAAAETQYCFKVSIGNPDEPIDEVTSQFTTAACGVTFNIGAGIQFQSIGGQDDYLDAINGVLNDYSYPLFMSFAGVEKAQSFPVSPDTIALGRMLQVFQETAPDTFEPTGQWTTDPYLGASSLIDDCDIEGDGSLDCALDTLEIPVSLQMGTMSTDGRLLQYGEYLLVKVQGAQLSAQASQSEAFSQLNNLTLSGSISQNDLEILAEASGNGDFIQWIGAIPLDVDADGDGVNESVSVEMLSTPTWVPMLGCDTQQY